MILVAFLLLVAGYAAPVFVPPAAAPVIPLAPDATLLERLFPGVPGWWVVARLLCLVAAAALVMRQCWGRPFSFRTGTAPSGTTVGDLSVLPIRVAVAVAAFLAIAGLWAAYFGRAAQLLYVLGLAVPPLLLVRWRDPWALPDVRRALQGTAVVGGLTGLWLLLRLPVSWRSPRATDLLDTWVGLQMLAQAADPAFNLLTDRFRPGSGSFHVIAQGAGLAGVLGVEPSFAWAQAAQFLWLGLAGMAVGCLAIRVMGIAAAAVTTATFLFSPFVLMMLLTPVPFFFYPCVVVGLVTLLVKVHDERSPAALAALGALAGIGATLHSAALVSVFMVVVGVWSALRPPRLPLAAAVAAVLLFVAGAVTTLSDLRQLDSMAQVYTRGRAQWVGHEMAGFGQISPQRSRYMVEGAIPRPLDTVMSAALAPVVLPRTPLRALGDTLFDPVGSGLAVIGIAVCLCAWRGSWFARVLLCMFAFGLLPATVAGLDRLSIIRLISMPIPMALLAGVGWRTIRPWLGAPGRSGIALAAVVLSIVAGGVIVFDRVNPSILPSSWQNLTLRALAEAPPAGGAVLLDHPRPQSFPWWRLNEMARHLAADQVSVRVYEEPRSLWTDAVGEQSVAELYFWSPGLEEDHEISRAVCQRWPGAAFYTLTDEAGLSRVFAARPEGADWRPALPPRQWWLAGCETQLETEATWAAAVLQQARDLQVQGRKAEAVAVLRAAARRNFAQAELFRVTAEAILADSGDADAVREAVHWARRACQVTRFRDPDALATLSAAYAAAGRQ